MRVILYVLARALPARPQRLAGKLLAARWLANVMIDGKGLGRPEVSRFFGISIRLYFDDHNPPHFHAIYAGAEVEVGLDPLAVLRGRFPRRALGMVMEWAALPQRELLDNWALVHNAQSPLKIDPLD